MTDSTDRRGDCDERDDGIERGERGVGRRKAIAALAAAFAGCGGSDPEPTGTVAEQLRDTPTRSPTPSPTPTPEPPVRLTVADTTSSVTGYPTFGHTARRTSHVVDDAGPPGPGEGWRHATPEAVHSSPAIADGRVYASSLEGCYAIDAATGKRVWRHFVGKPVHSGPAVVDGRVYVGGFDGFLRAVDAATGESVWRYDVDDVVPGSVAADERGVYAMGFDGRLHAVDFDGNRRWRLATDGQQVLGGPAVTGDTVFVGSNDDNLYAIDADAGRTVWRYGTRSGVGTTPAVTPETVYVAALDEHLYAVSAGRGRLRWERRIGTGISSPTVVGDELYVGTRDGTVYALDRATGDTRWRYRTDADVRSSPAVADGVLAVGSGDGAVHALGEGLRRVTPAAVDVVLDGAPNGVETFAVRIETGGTRIAAVVPRLVTGTGFTVDEGGADETFVVASGVVLSGTVSLGDDGRAVLFTVKLADAPGRDALSYAVRALTDADGEAMDHERVSLRLRTDDESTE